MARPQVVVNVSAALPRRGDPTATGTALFAFAGGSGVETPVRCRSAADAIAAFGNNDQSRAFAASVADALALGAPEVIGVRVKTASAASAVDEAGWAAALDLLTEDYGASGQVAIPGVDSDAAHLALLGHAAEMGSRVALLDASPTADVATLAGIAAEYAEAPSAHRAGLIAPAVAFPAPANSVRNVVGSVIASGLAARGDAIVGHTNHMPAGDQGRSAGYVTGGLRPTGLFGAADLDTLHDAGVSVIRQVRGRPTLYGWRSLSNDERFTQLNWGRFSGQLASGISVLAEAFLFERIDGRGQLFARLDGALRGYLAPLAAAGAIYATEDDPGYAVQVAEVNTPATIRRGELRAAVEVAMTPSAERVVIDVVTHIAQEA